MKAGYSLVHISAVYIVGGAAIATQHLHVEEGLSVSEINLTPEP